MLCMFLSLCACFYGFHSDMESGIFTWKEIYPRPVEMSFKQKIQSMTGSWFQNCTWLLSALTKMWLVKFQLFKKKVLAPFQCFILISAFYPQFSVLSPFQRFIPISAFYPQFSVLSPIQRSIPNSAFYPQFSVLSPFQRFIPISVFYPHFSVLSPFQRFIPNSAFYPHFSFRFQFPFQPFSFSVLSRPVSWFALQSWLVNCDYMCRDGSKTH